MSELKENTLTTCQEEEMVQISSDVNRSQKIMESAYHCLKSDLYTDVTFIIENRRFPAHRLVMESLSTYFKSLFKMDDKGKGELTLSSVSPEEFDALLNFAYTGQVDINENNVQNILIAADYFSIEFVKNSCIDFMESQFEVYNICDIFLFSINYSLLELRHRAVKFLHENLDNVSQSKAFSSLKPDLVHQLLNDDDLVLWHNKVLLKSVAREKFVLNAILRYISSQTELKDHILKELLCTVRLPELPQSVIDDCLSKFEDLKDNKVLQDVLSLRLKFLRYQNKKLRHNSLIDLTEIIGDLGNSDAWLRPRHLPNYVISVGRKRYASSGEDGKCVVLPIFSVHDPTNEIHRIDIWVRPWEGELVIGGLKLSYRNCGTYKECTRGDCHNLSEHYFVELEPNEFIVKVIVGSGSWLINKLGFETSLGKFFGPFGGLGNGKNTEKAPEGSFSYLYDINCDSVTIQGSDAVSNLVFRWISFQ